MDPRTRPLLIFDGDCGFCRRRVAGLAARTVERVDYVPSQEVGPDFPEIPPAEFDEAVVLVRPDGTRTRGAEAVFEALSHGRGPSRAALALYRRVPGFARVTEWGYALVARHRTGLSRLERALRGTEPAESSFRVAAWIFQKVLALCFLAGFLSLWPQILGLVGEHGILPIAQQLAPLREYAEREGAARWELLPSFVWWNASDTALLAHCVLGAAASGLLLAGLMPAVALLVATLLYLSLTAAGTTFLSFPWDALLVETGFLGLFLVPWRRRSKLATDPAPSGVARWLGWLLVVRLFFFSGVVKLASGGENLWLDLSALGFHFESQPLPTPLAYWAHALPRALSHLFCLSTLACELLLPLAIFAGRRARLVAACGFGGLQLAIAATGNYGFSNLVTLGLCALLVDDRAWTRSGLFRRAVQRERVELRSGRVQRSARGLLLAAYALGALVLGGLRWAHLAGNVLGRVQGAEPSETAQRLAGLGQPHVAHFDSLRAVNSYGLFAQVTRHRFEIDVQGSNDGKTWESYAFRWKPGDPARGLPWVAPHMPRLDWQMWFAALAGYQRSPWFQHFLHRLLEGSDDVEGLLAVNPFPDEPPRYVQARFLLYEFTTPTERRETGAIWKTTDKGPFVTPLELPPPPSKGRPGPFEDER